MSDATQNYVRIPLTQGKFAIIDAEDLPEIGKHRWFYTSGRAARNRTDADPKSFPRSIKMHRQIMGFPEGLEIDHIDGNPLNNRRLNLRLATHHQNVQNTGARRHNKIGLKGVKFRELKSKKNWYSTIIIHGKSLYLGSFFSPEEAAKAYSDKAKQVWGEFAKTEAAPQIEYTGAKITTRPPRANLTSSGYQGVYAHRSRPNKWIASYGRNTYLGVFDTPELASAAVEAKIKELRE